MYSCAEGFSQFLELEATLQICLSSACTAPYVRPQSCTSAAARHAWPVSSTFAASPRQQQASQSVWHRPPVPGNSRLTILAQATLQCPCSCCSSAKSLVLLLLA